MNGMNPKVSGFFGKSRQWLEELQQLRTIILECQLSEVLKWGKPCYQFQNSNVVLIQGFKEYFALLFFKGALFRDANGILVKPGENSQAAPDSLHQCSRNSREEAHLDGLYQ